MTTTGERFLFGVVSLVAILAVAAFVLRHLLTDPYGFGPRSKKEVTVELSGSPCIVNGAIDRIELYPDEAPGWQIENDCAGDQLVTLKNFQYLGKLKPNGTCPSPPAIPRVESPLDTDETCPPKGTAKPNRKRKLGRALKDGVPYGAGSDCYKYDVYLGTAMAVDPEFVIWR
jgi:hypothetical protein